MELHFGSCGWHQIYGRGPTANCGPHYCCYSSSSLCSMLLVPLISRSSKYLQCVKRCCSCLVVRKKVSACSEAQHGAWTECWLWAGCVWVQIHIELWRSLVGPWQIVALTLTSLTGLWGEKNEITTLKEEWIWMWWIINNMGGSRKWIRRSLVEILLVPWIH